MDKSFDPTHPELRVDVQESHDDEGGWLLSDDQLHNAYSYSTGKISSHRDDETSPARKFALLSGRGPGLQKNLAVS